MPPIQPHIFSFLSDIETPVSMFHKLSQQEETAFLLESTEGDTRLARYSFIGLKPRLTVQFSKGMATIQDFVLKTEQKEAFQNPLAVLKTLAESEPFASFVPPAESESAVPFSGGWVGYLGYGATQYFDNIPQQTQDPFEVPEGAYGLYDSVIAFDHLKRRIHMITYRPLEEATTLYDSVCQQLATQPSLPLLTCKESLVSEDNVFQHVTPTMDEATFCQNVKKAKEWIHEGQVFQIVLAHRFSLPVKASPIQIYRMIQAINPSPYAYYLKFPGFSYVGSSPETFVQCHQGRVMLKALAGTRPRGTTPELDAALEKELKANIKELAEHKMLVDLGRNDLGRHCQVNSIEIGEVASITRYTHVMHLATELSGTLQPEKTAWDVLQSCFPRGTVSGAPKIRAMNLLTQIENEQRGIYAGVVGYVDFFGNMDGAIAIRSVLLKDNMAHVNAGAGIVFDSEPASEYQETCNKAKSMLKAIQLANHVESPCQSQTKSSAPDPNHASAAERTPANV